MDTVAALAKYVGAKSKGQYFDWEQLEGVLERDQKAKHLYLGYVVDPRRFYDKKDEATLDHSEGCENSEVLDFGASASSSAEGKKRKGDWAPPSAQKKKHKTRGDLMSNIAVMLSSLRNVLPFLVSAEFPKFEFVRLKSATKKGGSEPLPASPADLLPRSAPSPYGDLKTHSTKIDKSVRLAFEIPAVDLALTDQADRFLDSFVAHASELLFDGRPLRLELSKLNVYPFQGHFRAHIDTPLEGVLGTVLVELPFRYIGGAFKIADSTAAFKHNPVQLESVNPLDESTKDKPADRMRALAFFGHCPHQVLEVKMGSRVTLTFYIKEKEAMESGASSASASGPVSKDGQDERKQTKGQKESITKGAKLKAKKKSSTTDTVERGKDDKATTVSVEEGEEGWRSLKTVSFGGIGADVRCFASITEGAHKPVDLASTVDCVVDAVEKIVRSSDSAADKHAAPVGILLSHKYSKSENERGHLKGSDSYLVAALRQANLPVEMLPVVVEHTEPIYPPGPDDVDPPKQTVYRMTESDVLALMGKGRFDVNPFLEVEFVGNRGDWRLVAEHERGYESDCEFTGNTDLPGVIANQYYTTAVVIDPQQIAQRKAKKTEKNA